MTDKIKNEILDYIIDRKQFLEDEKFRLNELLLELRADDAEVADNDLF